MSYNKLFEELDTTEQKAVKFAFELVAKNNVWGCSLVKLNANGTTGYPVYYLYMRDNGQGYVLRIIKQGRKCKLMPFGNPKLIWTFVKEKNAKMPKRTEATLECFTKIFSKNTGVANGVINWINRTIQSNLTLADFNVKNTVSSAPVASKPSSVSKPSSTTLKSDKDKKIALVQRELKKFIAAKKAKGSKYIIIKPYTLWDNNEKAFMKYWKDEDELACDMYRYDMDNITISGYNREHDIHKAGYWTRSDTRSYLIEVRFIAKPCKEFESLNKYIQNTLKCTPLKVDSVYSQSVHGKRNDIFHIYNTFMLAHDENLCKRYKTQLQKIRHANWKASIDIKHKWDRDEWSYRQECEWEGTEYNYAVVTFKTPSGKTVETFELWPKRVGYWD